MNTFYYRSTTVMGFLFCLLAGCFIHPDNQTITRTAAYPRVIERARKQDRPLFLYSGSDTFIIKSLLVEKHKQHVTVHLNRLDSLHRMQINDPKTSGEPQVHLYMRDSTIYTLDEPHTIPLNKIARIEVVEGRKS